MTKIICDIDGVILDLHSEIEKRVQEKFPYYKKEMLISYDLNRTLPRWLSEDEIKYYTVSEELRHEIVKYFYDVNVFESCEIDNKVVEMLRLLISNGCDIVFHSMSYTKEIADVKYSKLLSALEGYDFMYIPIIKSEGISKSGSSLVGDYKIDDNLLDLEPYLHKKEKGCMLVHTTYNDLKNNEEYIKYEKNGQLRIYKDTLNVLKAIAKEIDM